MNIKNICAAITVMAVLLASCGNSTAQPAQTSDAMAPTKAVEEDKATSEDAGTDDGVNVAQGTSQIYVKNETDGTDDGFQTLLGMMEENGESFYKTADSPTGMIENSDVVILFYNGQWDERGGTNTDLINAVVEAIASHPDEFNGEIIIADSGQGDGSLDHAKANSANRDQSILDVINKQKDLGVRVTGYLWDDIMDIEVEEFDQGDDEDGYIVEPGVSETTKLTISYPKFTTEYGTKISVKKGVWDGSGYDSDVVKLINMPVLKAHWLYRGTACVKNYMGMPSQNLSSKAGGDPHNSVGLGSMGQMMAESRMPVLNILDMIHIGAINGPWLTYDEATDYFAIAASTDPFALDYWAVKNVLKPEAERVGHSNWEDMDPDSDVPGTFGRWMNLSLEEIKKAGYTDFIFGSEDVVVHEQ